jgi:hypothetical protein
MKMSLDRWRIDAQLPDQFTDHLDANASPRLKKSHGSSPILSSDRILL